MNEVIINPPKTATGCVIWLHGLGADGHDFEPIVSELPREVTENTRFIFPHAPRRAITINGGMMMRGWYDVVTMDLTIKQDVAGTLHSQQLINEYLSQQMKQGIASDHIVLAGFSQGGAIALHTGLRYSQPLAGILALSTYLPLADTVVAEAHEANRHTTIFMGHGVHDPVIPVQYGEKSCAYLQQLGYLVEWHSYLMQHNVIASEIADIGHWLQQRLQTTEC